MRIVDTFPWLMLLTPKTLRVAYGRAPLLLLCFCLAVVAVFIGDNLPSTGKVIVFFGFISIVLLSKIQYLQISIRILLILFLLLAFEDLLIDYTGFLSPLVRDERGALFIFREKSYVALLVGFLVSYLPINRSERWKDLLVLAGVFYFLESALGYLIYIIYFYHRFQITARYLPRTDLVVFASLFSLYLAFDYFRTEGLIALISASDALRFLINLESLYITHIGSIYLHDAITYSSEVLNIKQGHFLYWDNLTPQAPFFVLSYFFGRYGFILGGVFYVCYVRALPSSNRYTAGFIHSMILINMFLQGFMLSPYLLGYLFISNLRDTEYDTNSN